MREFKFRAWDDEAKKMYSPEALEQPEIEDETRRTIYCYLSFGVLYIYDFRAAEPVEFVPMQATGWFDKKRNEVYEGDILQVEENGQVSLCKVIWSEEIAGFMILSHDGMSMVGGPHMTDFVEVVGNIYENPDMMTYR